MADSPWQHEAFVRLSLEKMDERFLPGTAQEVDFLIHHLALPPSARILDLGCGAGRHAIEFARRGYDVIGIDVSPTMLAEAAARAAAASVVVEWRQGDLRQLASMELPAQTFDLALCLCESGFGVLGSEEADLRFLRVVAHLLRDDARLVITCLNAIRKYRRLGAAFDYCTGIVHWQAPMNDGSLCEDQRIYTPSEMRLLLTLAGFADVTIYGCQPGHFAGQSLLADDIEMMVLARHTEEPKKQANGAISMDELELVKPSMRFAGSFLAMNREMIASDTRLHGVLPTTPEGAQVEIERWEVREATGDAWTGGIPTSHYWLIRNGSEVIGSCSLRHSLDEPHRAIGHVDYGITFSERGKGYGLTPTGAPAGEGPREGHAASGCRYQPREHRLAESRGKEWGYIKW